MNIQEVRQKYPQYNDMSDTQLADALHSKFYSDMDKSAVYEKMGISGGQEPNLLESARALTDTINPAAQVGRMIRLAQGNEADITALEQGAQGATFGFADDGYDRVVAGAKSLAGGGDYENLLKTQRQATQDRLTQQFSDRPALSIGANLLGGTALGGPLAATKAGGLFANSLRTGNTASRAAKGGVTASASGALFGAGTAEDGSKSEGATVGAVIGAPLGAVPALAGPTANAVSNAIIPKIDDAIKPLADKAVKLGIPLRADQVSPSKMRSTVQKVSEAIPGSGGAQFADKQRVAFTKAVVKTIGQDADDLGPSTIKAFKKRNGNGFERILGDRKIDMDIMDAQRIASLRTTLDDTLGLNDRDANILRGQIKKIAEDLSENSLSGKKLASIRSGLVEKASKAGNGKPIYSEAIEIIDDIAEKSLKPNQVAKLKELRREYRNFKTLEPLIEKAEGGVISPTQLMNRVKASKYITAADKAIGEDDLVDLARIGQILKNPGGSDTFEKSALFGQVGFGGAGLAVDPVGTASLAGLTIGGNRLLQKGILQNQGLINAGIKRPASNVFLPGGQTLGLLSGNAATLPTR